MRSDAPRLRPDVDPFLRARRVARTFGVNFLLLILAGPRAASADDAFPKSGAAKLDAFTICRSLAIVDMGPVGSNSSAECFGIVKNRDGAKLLDNVAIRCLEESRARPDGYAFTGTCIQTDGDGDRLYMTYEGVESGAVALIGGTGKYTAIGGKGTWSVVDAPGNTASQFAFTLSYDVIWMTKEK